MHYYKLQMNVEGNKRPDWQTIGELETDTPIASASEAQFLISNSIDETDKKLVKQTDGAWIKTKNGFHRTFIPTSGTSIQFQLIKDLS